MEWKRKLFLFTLFFLVSCSNDNIEIYDVHEHILDEHQLYKFEKVLDEVKVSSIIFVASPKLTLQGKGEKSFKGYEDNNNEVLKIAQKENYFAFCTLDVTKEKYLDEAKQCISKGGSGFKLYNGHSFFYPLFVPLNDSIMNPFYEYVEENQIPITFHINFWRYFNEFEAVMKKYPNLVVNIPHFALDTANSFRKLTPIFDKYPNTYTDISFGSPQFLAEGFSRISENPERFRDFITTYQDRILFGADMVVTNTAWKNEDYILNSYSCYRDVLEKKDFSCPLINDYYKKNNQKAKLLNGLNLDKDILVKIYQNNPRRFLGIN